MMRVWYNGRTSAFQADDAGSIPATRSRSGLRESGLGSLDRLGLEPGFAVGKRLVKVSAQAETSAHIAQAVEHFLGKEEVIGSNPIVSTTKQN